jgi:hypothetical protein
MLNQQEKQREGAELMAITVQNPAVTAGGSRVAPTGNVGADKASPQSSKQHSHQHLVSQMWLLFGYLVVPSLALLPSVVSILPLGSIKVLAQAACIVMCLESIGFALLIGLCREPVSLSYARTLSLFLHSHSPKHCHIQLAAVRQCHCHTVSVQIVLQTAASFLLGQAYLRPFCPA